jgi:hypothetical protein
MKKEDCKVGEHYMLVVNGKRVGKVRYLCAGTGGSAYVSVTSAATSGYYPHECLRRIKPKREKRRWFVNLYDHALVGSGLHDAKETAFEVAARRASDYIGTVEVREVRWVKRAGEGGKP